MSAEREALAGLAAEVLAGRTSNDQLAAVERSQERWDSALWKELAGAGLLGLCLPEEVGGAGLGLTELCLLLEQHGRFLAPVPLWETTVAALVLAEAGQTDVLPSVVDGSLKLSVAVDLGGGAFASGPFDALVVVDGDEVRYSASPTVTAVESTNHTHLYDVVDAPGVVLDVAADRVRDLVRVALSAVQLGVADAGVREAAKHLSGREQFGRPLATFQATTQQLGDAYCDVQAMRATVGQAAHTTDRRDVDIACWWATDAAERVQHAVQHLHGGLGADITYPVHRRLLWTMRTNALLGGPSRQLARLGALVVA